jgi:hypothetical protein
VPLELAEQVTLPLLHYRSGIIEMSLPARKKTNVLG